MEQRCEKSDLLVTDCAHCRNKFKDVERLKTAEYRSTCSCGAAINIGDRIGLLDGVWVCPNCTREAKV